MTVLLIISKKQKNEQQNQGANCNPGNESVFSF